MKTLMIISTAHGGMFFSLTYLAAFLVAAGMMVHEGFRKGYPKSAWLLIFLTGVIFFIIGDKVFTYSSEEWAEVFTRFHFPEAHKKTVLGGIIGLFTGLVLAKTWLRFNRPVLDSLAVAMPLAMAISRIGCLMEGCCFGTPTNLPWGVHYDAASWAYQAHLSQGLVHLHDNVSLAVHPAQLYQVIGCLIIALIVWRNRKQWKSGGSLFLFSVLCYAVLRFFVEFVRAPETDFFAGQIYRELKIIQWLILVAFILGIVTLILLEKKRKASSVVSGPIRLTDFRLVFLTAILCMMVFCARNWFTLLELSTILLILIPVVIVLSVKIYRRYSVAGFRWVVPVLLLCSIGFMSQKSSPTVKQDDKIIFTDVGITGLVGSYYENDSWVSKDWVDDGCGGFYTTTLHDLDQSKRNIYQGGIDISHNKWAGKYYKFSVGARGYFSSESGEYSTDYPHTKNLYGISPYITFNWHYFGFGTGFTLGQMKLPLGNKPVSSYNEGDIITTEYNNLYFLPSLSLRFGPSDILYAEGTFPGPFPSSATYPLYRAGVGSGLGKTNGTKAAFGYCDGIYAQFVYPIKNKVVLEALYADNLAPGNQSKRIFSFGIHYRFVREKKNPK